MNSSSEFGKGFTYCIALFLGHSMSDRIKDPRLWFNGASDHLYELEIPKSHPQKDEIQEWRDKVLHWGHGFTEPHAELADVEWSINKATEFLRTWDTTCGIDVIKGEWE